MASSSHNSRRRFLQQSTTGLAGILISRQAPAIVHRKPPNILLVMSDQEQARVDLPKALPLPQHERLLENSLEFANYHVTTAPCTPSRSVLYTGQHSKFTGAVANANTPFFNELPRSMPTLGTMLRECGYYTAYKGKWHLGSLGPAPDPQGMRYPNKSNALQDYGFADYSEIGDAIGSTWEGFMRDREIANDAARWLHDRGRGLKHEQPWFLAVNLVNPHDVMFYQAHANQVDSRLHHNLLSPLRGAPLSSPYDRSWEDLPLPENVTAQNLDHQPGMHQRYVEFCDYFYGAMPRDDLALWRKFRSYYFNCIRDVDRHLGTVLDALDTTGLADNTIVVYTSDHGELAGAHGLRQKGPFIYKENLRVPLLIRHPDLPGGNQRTEAASAVDLVPTLLGLAGGDEVIARHTQLKGVNLAPALDTDSPSERSKTGVLVYLSLIMTDFNFFKDVASAGVQDSFSGWFNARFIKGKWTPDFSQRGVLRGMFDGRYRFGRYFGLGEHHTPQNFDTLVKHNDLELYDTATDPTEMRNLAQNPAKHADLITQQNDKLNALIQSEIGNDDGAEFPGPTSLYRL
ncbi:MAG: arylsulfatase A-like enzyme [Limisphaerales bacterium]